MYSATHEYEACVLVNGKPVTEVEHNGRTYIEGRKDSEYALRFKNTTSERILIVPSVDGLNVLDGKPCGIKSDGYVVNAWQTITIPGWTVDNSTAAKFTFKPQDSYYEEDETYVEQMGKDASNQGVIGFMLFKEKQYISDLWSTTIPCSGGGGTRTRGFSGGVGSSRVYGAAVNGSSFTYDCNVVSSNTVQSSDPDEGKNLGTGFGESTNFNTVNVSFDRANPSNPDVVFAFYYDTVQNLKKMGVPTRAFRKRKKAQKQRPNPFPVSPSIMPLRKGCDLPSNWRK